MLAGVYIGENVTEEELLSIDGGKQFEKINEGKIYCTGFIDFQYGTYLSPQSPVHKKVIDILTKNRITFETKEVSRSSSAPTIPEIYEEMIQKTDEYNASIQAERFFSYYDSNGWKVGKNPMKNWKSAVAGWLNRSTPEKKVVTNEDIKNNIKKQANKKLSEL